METVLSPEGNIKIPDSFIKENHLSIGTRFIVQQNNGIIQLVPLNDEYISSLRGILEKGGLEVLMEMRNQERTV
jgi:hypothetical protein